MIPTGHRFPVAAGASRAARTPACSAVGCPFEESSWASTAGGVLGLIADLVQSPGDAAGRPRARSTAPKSLSTIFSSISVRPGSMSSRAFHSFVLEQHPGQQPRVVTALGRARYETVAQLSGRPRGLGVLGLISTGVLMVVVRAPPDQRTAGCTPPLLHRVQLAEPGFGGSDAVIDSPLLSARIMTRPCAISAPPADRRGGRCA